jgi:hypothetical protein
MVKDGLSSISDSPIPVSCPHLWAPISIVRFCFKTVLTTDYWSGWLGSIQR